jgi:hypothetical protein
MAAVSGCALRGSTLPKSFDEGGELCYLRHVNGNLNLLLSSALLLRRAAVGL